MTDPSGDGPLQVTFWGTRGSISTPGRATEKYGGNTPCVSIEHGDTMIIIDAGTGIRNLGIELVERFSERESLDLHLLLSHTHWDHIQGLPFFQPAYMPGVKLQIYGAARKGGFLESILRGQMDQEYFPVSMSALGAELSVHELEPGTFSIGGLTVDWEDQIYHPGGCIRYRFRCGDKTIVYASDVELNKLIGTDNQEAEKQAQLADYRAFVHRADLLIGDGQYTEDEYLTKKHFGHTTIPVLLDQARQAEVRQLAIFHHDPQHSDTFLDEYLLDLTTDRDPNDELNFMLAREGITLPI